MGVKLNTSTSSTATHMPHQRASFYGAGRHWVFYTDGINFGYRSSVDGKTWSAFTAIRGATIGRLFSVWYDGTYVHYVIAPEGVRAYTYYRRGVPNADGSITWSAPEQSAILPGANNANKPVARWFPRGVPQYAEVACLDRYYAPAEIYTTGVNIGTYGAGYKFVFLPGSEVSVPYSTTLPTAIQMRGWQGEWWYLLEATPRPIDVLDGRFPLRLRLQNPDAIVHEGYVWARLWKSVNADMTGAVAVTDWIRSGLVSFTGVAGEIIDVTINIDINLGVGTAFVLDGEYLYLELIWDVVTPATNARVYVETGNASNIEVPSGIPYVSMIAVDSDGYPWIGWARYNGIAKYPYIAKGDATDGTFTFINSTVRKLSTESAVNWSVIPVPLKDAKLYVVYTRTVVLREGLVHGQLWDGTTWGAEEDVATLVGLTLEHFYMLSVVADVDDNVHLVGNEDVSQDIEYTVRNYVTGEWSALETVQATTTTTSSPVLAIDPATGELYCFWAGSPTADHIFYKKRVAGVWDADPTDWIDESADRLTGNERLTCFYQVYNSYVGLAYMTLPASPYNVKFNFLTVVVVVPKIYIDGFVTISTT